MTKHTIILLLALAFTAVTFTGTASAKDQTEGADIFSYYTKYQGPFKSKQLYKRSEGKMIWYASTRFQKLKDISCQEASLKLRTRGTWTGNLSDKGECLGSAEASEWTTGSYLNYLSEKNNKKRQKQKLNKKTAIKGLIEE